MIAAYYGRVSTHRQEKEETIETQIMAIKDFAKEKGLTLVKEYKDENWSGTILARPALDELRLDAKKKLWEAIIFYDPDRLARRYPYQAIIIDELEELGVKVLFVTTPPAKTEEDKLLYGVKGLFAEYERGRITERFRLGRVRRAREGHIVASESTYGLKYVKDTEEEIGHNEIIEPERKVAEMIFKWIGNEKMTIRQVAIRLKELGIPPRKSKSGVWRISTLTNMLHNTTYIGIAHFNRSESIVPEHPIKNEKYKKVKKTSRRLRPEAEWIKIPSPRIISDDLFERVQKQLRINYEMCQRNKKNEYLLSNLIYCACGARRNGEGPQKGKHLYYRCSNRVHNFPLPPTCHEKGVNARIADRLVWDGIKNLMNSPVLIERQLKRWVSQKQQVKVDNSDSIAKLQTELNKIKNEEKRYIKVYGSGFINQEQLEEAMRDLNIRKTSLEKQIASAAELKKQTDIIQPDKTWIQNFSQKAKETLQVLNFIDKQKIVRQCIDKIIATQNELNVHGFLSLEYVKLQPIVRDCGFSECRKVDAV